MVKKRKEKRENDTEPTEQPPEKASREKRKSKEVEKEPEAPDTQEQIAVAPKKRKPRWEKKADVVPAETEAAREPQSPKDAVNEASMELGEQQEKSSELGDEAETLEVLRAPAKMAGTAEKVQRVLPDWITHPRPISSSVVSECGGPACEQLCANPACLHFCGESFLVDSVPWLSEPLKDILRKQQIATLFPVQAAVGPAICFGFSSSYTPGDICVSAPTGSGKTLSYVLPILECLRSRVVRRLRCLVVLPTKDLVVQVAPVFSSRSRAGQEDIRVLRPQHQRRAPTRHRRVDGPDGVLEGAAPVCGRGREQDRRVGDDPGSPGGPHQGHT
jgi:hypothetical protein